MSDALAEHPMHLFQLARGNRTAEYFLHYALTEQLLSANPRNHLTNYLLGTTMVFDIPITTLLTLKMFMYAKLCFIYLFTHSCNHSKINASAQYVLCIVLNIPYSIDQVQEKLLVPLRELIVYISFKEPTVAFKKTG